MRACVQPHVGSEEPLLMKSGLHVCSTDAIIFNKTLFDNKIVTINVTLVKL